MKFYGNGGTCGSETHLKRDCPHKTGSAAGTAVNYVETWIATDDAEDHPTTRTSERNEEFIFVMWHSHTFPPRKDDNMRWQPYDHTQWEAAGWVDANVFPDNNVEIESATGASGASKGADKAKSSWWNSDLDWGEYHGSDIHKRDELESVDEPELESDDEPERVITRTASSKAAATASSKAAPIAPKRSSRHEDGVKKARRGKTSAHKRSQTSIIMRQIRQDYVEGERRRTCDCPRWEAHVPGYNLKNHDARPLLVAPH